MPKRSIAIAAAGLIIGSLVTAKGPGWASRLSAALPDPGPPVVKYNAEAVGRSQRARFYAASKTAPLVVDLHQWSSDETGSNGEDMRIDLAVKAKGWNFIRPSLEGRNNHPRACCSKMVMAEINAAIEYAKRNAPVDPRAIYIVGESGGAYTALCAYMSGEVHATAFYAWAPITDLAAWRNEHPNDRYGQDVDGCTGSTVNALNREECRKRSPMTIGNGQPGTPLYIFAGVHDGSTGSVRTTGAVPFDHSIKFFNRLAELRGNPVQRIDAATSMALADDRTGPDTARQISVGGRRVHLYRKEGNSHVVIFEGEHEMLSMPTLKLIERDYSRRKLNAGRA